MQNNRHAPQSSMSRVLRRPRIFAALAAAVVASMVFAHAALAQSGSAPATDAPSAMSPAAPNSTAPSEAPAGGGPLPGEHVVSNAELPQDLSPWGMFLQRRHRREGWS